MKVCVALDGDGKIAITSRAKYMGLGELRDGTVIIEKLVDNPALKARERRPTFIAECARLGAEAVVAAHGSYCAPSSAAARRLGLRLLVADAGDRPESPRLRGSGVAEVVYSSFLAVVERIRGH